MWCPEKPLYKLQKLPVPYLFIDPSYKQPKLLSNSHFLHTNTNTSIAKMFGWGMYISSTQWYPPMLTCSHRRCSRRLQEDPELRQQSRAQP